MTTATYQTITIYHDNAWSGMGRLDECGVISDCSAELGPNQRASEATYEAIEDALEADDDGRYSGSGEIARPDGIYSWTIA